ncbi:hypothetical protein [Nocardia spumae]|uniref:hypothetical protein n=1 Tax=Nocardia spumae TaxID=2887190 RepID=UPI001D1581BC|nr:hypothetical protein [Nocardia spumae]
MTQSRSQILDYAQNVEQDALAGLFTDDLLPECELLADRRPCENPVCWIVTTLCCSTVVFACDSCLTDLRDTFDAYRTIRCGARHCRARLTSFEDAVQVMPL